MRAIILAIVMILLPATVHAQASDRKVALIIANSTYVATNTLVNPANDAILVADAAKRAGFEVILARNAGLANFQRALRDFRTKADGARVAMVYYAGHGIEGSGKNWLIPVDAKLESGLDLPYEAIDLDRVMESMSGAQVRIVVLDACRNNPFGRSWRSSTRAVQRGLAGIEVDDVLVIYAAAPGQTASDGEGANSPFATSLARRLAEPDLPIQLLGGAVRDDVLAATGGSQRPFVSSSITGTPIYLVPRTSGLLGAAAMASLSTDTTTLDALAWQGALGAQSVAGFEEYKAQFPNGRFNKLAEQNITRLSSASAMPGRADATSTSQSVATERGYVGVQTQALTEDMAASLGLTKDIGEIISTVDPDKGAARAGMLAGDVVVTVDGRKVSPQQPLSFIIANIAPGKRILVEVIRAGQRIALNVVVGRRPSEEVLAKANKDNTPQGQADMTSNVSIARPGQGVIEKGLGLAVVDLTPTIARQLDRENTSGVVITAVDDLSDAASKGLRRADVILSANNGPISSERDLEAALRAAQNSGRGTLLLRVSRKGQPPVYLAVRLRR